MVSRDAVEEQLKRIGCNFRFWGRSEVNELGRILMEDEVIAECVNGEYANGFAMLVVTNHRLLLVDKKPLLYLTVEDYRYEMITEFNYNHRLINATVNIYTANKTLTFTSWNQHRLRKLLEYIQARVLEMRQQQHVAQQFQAAAAAQYAQMYAARTMQAQALPAVDQPERIESQGAVLQAPATDESRPTDVLTPQQLIRGLSNKRMARGLAHGRAVLGTYTRSKLPSFRRLQLSSPGPKPDQDYPELKLGDYYLPYEYES